MIGNPTDYYPVSGIRTLEEAPLPVSSEKIASIEILWGLDPKRGGIAASVPDLTAAISRHGRVNAKVVALAPGARAKTQPVNSNVVTLPAGRVRWLRDSNLRVELRKIVAEASVVHIHGLWQEHGIVAAAAAKKLDIPYIVSAHGMLETQALRAKRWKKAIYAAMFERRCLACASALRALTRAEVDDYRRFGLKAPAFVVPNGVTFPEHPDSGQFLSEFPRLAGRRLILYLSRLHPKKKPDLLIRAWSRMGPRFADAHLVLAGPDEAGTQIGLSQLATDLGVADRVTFTGMLQGDMKWSALAAAEVFVLPSFSEGFSVAALEAMACSRPVILTRQCNFPEVAQHQAGLIVEPEERQIERALVDVLTLCAGDRAAMGARGRELVRSKYSWASVASSMIEVYDWLCGGSLPRSVEIHCA